MSNQAENRKDQNYNQGRNFNQNPCLNQRPNVNEGYNRRRNQKPNFNQNRNPSKNFEVLCYSRNTPGHTFRNCNKQLNIDQQLPSPPQQHQQQFQEQEFNKQGNSNPLPGTGAQRRA